MGREVEDVAQIVTPTDRRYGVVENDLEVIGLESMGPAETDVVVDVLPKGRRDDAIEESLYDEMSRGISKPFSGAPLEVAASEDLEVAVSVVLPTESAPFAVNLRAPIVMSGPRRRGVQRASPDEAHALPYKPESTGTGASTCSS